MMTKTQPNISIDEFLFLTNTVAEFRSITGKEYDNVKTIGTSMTFTRKSTKVVWEMDLTQVHRAYIELTDFKTKNFAPYIPRRHSPALGLLVHLGLLKII